MNINRFQRASTNAYTYQLSDPTRPKIESFLLTSWGGILCRPHFNHPSTPSSCCSAHHRRDCLKNSLNFANINLSLPPTHTLQQQHHDDDNYNFALHMHLLLPLMRWDRGINDIISNNDDAKNILQNVSNVQQEREREIVHIKKQIMHCKKMQRLRLGSFHSLTHSFRGNRLYGTKY